MDTIIKNADGLFLITVNTQVARWSAEYPDARTFRTVADARKYAARLPATMALVRAKILKNYGLDSETKFNI